MDLDRGSENAIDGSPGLDYLLFPSPNPTKLSHLSPSRVFPGKRAAYSWLGKQHKATPLGHQIACNKCEQVNFVACSQRQRQRVFHCQARSEEPPLQLLLSGQRRQVDYQLGNCWAGDSGLCVPDKYAQCQSTGTAGMPVASSCSSVSSFLLSGPILMRHHQLSTGWHGNAMNFKASPTGPKGKFGRTKRLDCILILMHLFMRGWGWAWG